MNYILKTEINKQGVEVFSREVYGDDLGYIVKNQSGFIGIVNKEWLLHYKDSILNLGIDKSDSFYPKEYERPKKFNINFDDCEYDFYDYTTCIDAGLNSIKETLLKKGSIRFYGSSCFRHYLSSSTVDAEGEFSIPDELIASVKQALLSLENSCKVYHVRDGLDYDYGNYFVLGDKEKDKICSALIEMYEDSDYCNHYTSKYREEMRLGRLKDNLMACQIDVDIWGKRAKKLKAKISKLNQKDNKAEFEKFSKQLNEAEKELTISEHRLYHAEEIYDECERNIVYHAEALEREYDTSWLVVTEITCER